jgi:predicted SnoaL-like aldol condensation-catalyzing enzyme
MLADTMIRHDLRLVIEDHDGEHVAIVYDGTVVQSGQVIHVASIEVYRVVDGQISEMWNFGAKQGLWL